MRQKELLEYLSNHILGIKIGHPVSVGIDGVDASGKTTLADALADYLKMKRRDVIRASIDSFHNPKSIRYQKGRYSPVGYYQDSFDNQAVIDNLLAPLAENGNLRYRTAIFDYRIDREVCSPMETAHPDSVLVMEGVFLFRPELVGYWDLKIHVETDPMLTLSRAVKRDSHYPGSEREILDLYHRRYVPGQQRYLLEAKPQEIANIVINNNDFENPTLLRPKLIP